MSLALAKEFFVAIALVICLLVGTYLVNLVGRAEDLVSAAQEKRIKECTSTCHPNPVSSWTATVCECDLSAKGF